jgi:aspartyl-tRNA(Asn)/glutamyl-tRNA(Gln) amidotransferase subunit C
MSVAMAEVINKEVPSVSITVVETGATNDNFRRMERDELSFGQAGGTDVYMANNGIGVWKDRGMNIEDLKETAALAHLNMDEAELAGAFPAFEQMLGYFAAMQAADEDGAAFPAPVRDLAPGGHAGSSQTVAAGFFRPDNNNSNNNSNVNGSAREVLASNLLQNAGERDGRFIVVPNVL